MNMSVQRPSGQKKIYVGLQRKRKQRKIENETYTYWVVELK